MLFISPQLRETTDTIRCGQEHKDRSPEKREGGAHHVFMQDFVSQVPAAEAENILRHVFREGHGAQYLR
jgi:hypothetical protein